MTNKSEQVQERIENQRKYCDEKKVPHFAPSTGICFGCRKQIYDKVDGQSHVLRCSFCSTSYCS